LGLASLVGATFGALLVHKAMPEQINARGLASRYSIGAWLGAALPMMLGMSSRLILNRTDILLLAPLSSMEEVGYFGAAMRLTYALTFPQVILNSVAAPMLSEAYAPGKFGLLKQRFNGMMLFALVTASPLAMAIWWLREPLIIFVFGDAFAPSADILALVVFSQVAVGLSLPCSSLLMMTGNERAFAIEGLLALVVNVILCIYLIPQYGSIGAAMALCGSSGTFFITQFWLSRRVMYRLFQGVAPTD
jgi:O-antigen/teichoic acid export membrane protein